MSRIYIAGKVTGTSDYIERFAKAEEWLLEHDTECTVANPVKVNAGLPENTPYKDYIHIGLEMLRACDTIYMLKGWENSSGAVLEHQYAKTLGYQIIYEG